MLTRLTTGAAVAIVVAACASAPPSATDPPPPTTVAARWIAEDGSVVVVNLVAPADSGAGQARHLADSEHAEHPGARVIVRIFAATAGPERYVIGHVPRADEPLTQTSAPPSLVGIFDFPQ